MSESKLIEESKHYWSTSFHDNEYGRITGLSMSFDEKFLFQVQAINDSTPMMIYDETRQCQFSYMSTGPGFHEVLDAVQKEPTWGGRKTFMKASFDKAGVCTMYPGTAGVKNKYSWQNKYAWVTGLIVYNNGSSVDN